MSVLVADVGGTNTRLSVLDKSGQPGKVQRFSNDNFARFTDVLDAYGHGDFTACVIAIAGPVTPDHAALTNRDWVFQPSEIAKKIGLVGAENIVLMNDLAALGYALPSFQPSQLSAIRNVAHSGKTNGQSLVVGIGTGFNVALVKTGSGGPVVLESELGHTCLPKSLADVLTQISPKAPRQFPSNEEVFAGRGVVQMHQFLGGTSLLSGSQIIERYQCDETAAKTVDLLTELLGLLTQQLIYTFLPFDGIYFAGGVARGILGSPAQDRFLEALGRPGLLSGQIDRVAVHLVTDDAAALAGIAHVAKSKGFLA